MKHDLGIAKVDSALQNEIVADERLVSETLRNQLDYLYATLPNSFVEWNQDNCLKERDEVEKLYTAFTLKKDLHSLLTFENALMVLQTKAFESDMCAPINEQIGAERKQLTREDFLQMGFTESQLDRAIKRLSY